MKKNQLQLLAATCLHIASKIEDDVAVNVQELHYCADRIFKAKDIVELEEHIFQQIDWSLSLPTIYDFVMIYQEHLGDKNKRHHCEPSLYSLITL